MPKASFNTLLTTNGEYFFPAVRPGAEHVISIEGGFGGGNATLGYASDADVFIPFVDSIGGSSVILSAAGGIEARIPHPGKLAVKLLSVSGSTATLIVKAVPAV